MKKVILRTRDKKQVTYDPNQGGFALWQEMPCLRCGVCCTRWQPPVDNRESAAITRALDISLTEFYRQYAQVYPMKPNSYLLKRGDNACVFLKYEDTEASCRIHEVRPQACRNWIPSLSRRECRAGLQKRQAKVLLAGELYSSTADLDRFCHLIKNCNNVEEE